VNKSTNEVVDADYLTVYKYVIFKNYAFFSCIVLLITIAITLFVFTIYHLHLINLNVSTNEKSKKAKLIKFMKLIMDTLKGLSKEKEYDLSQYQNVTLGKDDIVKYKNIAFKSKNRIIIMLKNILDPEFDLASLSYEEVLKFYKFAEHSTILYKRNPYYKGFWKNFKDIINGV
jgi:hypothetical protein